MNEPEPDANRLSRISVIASVLANKTHNKVLDAFQS